MYEPLPPINMSDLEQNILQPYGEGEIEFNQNTVPFDFDGQRLLWMKYSNNDVREIYIYHFAEQKIELVKTFNKSDGMISNVKFLKQPGGGVKYLFYVKDGQYIVRLNLQSRDQEVIGRTADVVVAFNVTYNHKRLKDVMICAKQQAAEDLEQQMPDPQHFNVVCLDESQNITLFCQNSILNKYEFKVHIARGMTGELKSKDWFGMGYPYFICYYDKYIACSSDYGVLLF